MKAIVPATVLLAIVSAPTSAQTVRGVWKPVEVVISKGPNAGRHTTDVQPGLLFLTDSHYSIMFVSGFAARPHLSAQPTDSERARAFESFIAQAGTYQLKDSILTRTPTVAKNPGVMVGQSYATRMRAVADTIWFTVTAADTVETRTKWVRVERLPAR
jgi:hypothetical protein